MKRDIKNPHLSVRPLRRFSAKIINEDVKGNFILVEAYDQELKSIQAEYTRSTEYFKSNKRRHEIGKQERDRALQAIVRRLPEITDRAIRNRFIHVGGSSFFTRALYEALETAYEAGAKMKTKKSSGG